MTKNILMIVGSLRRHSFNRSLAEHIVTVLGDEAVVTFADIHDLPLMNQDIEFPAPAAVVRLRQQVQAADALWLVSPEYNGTIPGGLKNALDWLSRPTEAGTFGAPDFLQHLPVAISGAGGKDAAAGSLRDLYQLLQFMGLDPLAKTVGLQIPTAALMTDQFDLSDDQMAQIRHQVAASQAR